MRTASKKREIATRTEVGAVSSVSPKTGYAQVEQFKQRRQDMIGGSGEDEAVEPHHDIIARLLNRVRSQVMFLMLAAVVMPMVAYQITFSVPSYVTVQAATILGSAAAIFCGYLAYRRLLVMPGISSGGYIVTSMAASFGLLVALLLLLRIDYTRWQLLSSYLLSTAALLFIHLRVERRRHRTFAFIPGGRTNSLPQLPNVKWHRIMRPDERLARVHSIVVDLHHEHEAAWEVAIARWVLEGIPVYDTRVVTEQLTGRVEIRHISENTLGSLNPNAVLLKAKSVVDCVAAFTILIAMAPLMTAIGLAIRLDSQGPAIFKQKRMGFRARPFTVYKFRTMRTASDADDESARQKAMTQDDDVRITRVGRLLRRSRLDELPQLINILKGEMSLIGPRPEAVSLSHWYEREIPYYHYRHIIKPGLTGWAQINQGHVTSVEEIREKLHLDFYYVKNYSVWLDILIALRTLAIMTTGYGAR